MSRLGKTVMFSPTVTAAEDVPGTSSPPVRARAVTAARRVRPEYRRGETSARAVTPSTSGEVWLIEFLPFRRGAGSAGGRGGLP